MGAAVVFRHDFDVLMTVASVKGVLDPEIREVHGIVEVRQVVFLGPLLDLARIPIRTSVAIRPVPVPFLKKALVLALEVLLKDHSTDVCPSIAEKLFLA